MENLKEKTQTGVSLSFLTTLGTQAFQFILGIILARFLTPNDYGLVGMLAIFISIADVFIDSGFGVAVIRKKSPTSLDYSTVFWFNILVSFIAYILLFLGSNYISSFYNEEKLTDLTKVIGLVIIINAFGSIQGKYLNKQMQYKKLTIIYLITIFASSIVGVIFAILSYGPWALVIRSISWSLFLSVGWWVVSSWKPKYEFSWVSFKELGNFGSKILATSLFYSFFSNVYSVIVGKVYDATSLGYITRAKQFFDLPEKNIRSSSMNIFFTSLSYIQDDDERLIKAYKKILAVFAYILFPLYFMLAILAEPLISLFLTKKWLEAAPLLQYFCVLAFALPFESANENILYIKGKSGYIFIITVIRKVTYIVLIFLFYGLGLKGIVFAFIIEGYLGVILVKFFANKVLIFSFKEQISSVLPSLYLSVIASTGMFGMFLILNSDLLKVIFVPLIGGIIYITFSHFTKRFELKEILELFKVFTKKINIA